MAKKCIVDSSDSIDRLEEIRDEMLNLLEEAIDIVKSNANRSTYDRAKSYWYAHIEGNLSGGKYNGSMTNIDETIEEMKEELGY